jgi:quinol monooxygenase YgiN
MIGRLMTMTARPGRGDELAALMLKAAGSLSGFPGCQVYLISQDATDRDKVHVTEVWQDEAAAQAALTAEPTGDAPSPADALALMAGPPERTDLTVLGGVGA